MTSIRWKLILTCVAVVLLPTLYLSRYAVDSFDRFSRKVREQELANYAFIAGRQYQSLILAREPGGPDDATTEFRDLLAAYGTRIDARIRIVTREGLTIYDSDVDDPAVGVNVANLREIRQARDGGYGARWALTEDRRFVFYYIALPVTDDAGEVVAIAYATGHTAPIIDAITKMVSDQRRALVVALALGILAAALLAQTITRRLRKLTRAANDFTKGEAPLDVQIDGRDEVAQLGRAVQQMATELDRRNRHNTEFLSAAMHELRMPLTAIKGAAEILDQGADNDPEARRKFLANIRYETDRLVRMVWELNELTKLDIEELRGQKQEVEYAQFVQDVIDRFLVTIDGEHARVATEFDAPDARAAIVPGRMEQVLWNLLENALRYTPTTGTVTVRVNADDDGSVVTGVHDTGCGVAAGNLDKVFDRFFTTEPKDQPREYGSGLGLAIAKSIVENHRGRIWVENAPGGGAAFQFSLPSS